MLPLGSADVNVRSGMPTAESRRSPFGQFAPILVIPAVWPALQTGRTTTCGVRQTWVERPVTSPVQICAKMLTNRPNGFHEKPPDAPDLVVGPDLILNPAATARW